MSSQQANEGVKLPPINESLLRGPHRSTGASGASADGTGTFPVSTVGAAGDGRGAQQLNIRSVPAISDVAHHNMPGGRQGRTTHISNSSTDYIDKINKPRQTSKPAIIAFDGFNVSHGKSRRKVNGFFPPVKLRKGGKGSNENAEGPNLGKIQLTPTGHTEIRSRSVMSRQMGYYVSSRMSPDSMRTAQTAPEGIVYPNIINDTDYNITVLPNNKKVLPRREVPWVFRYKVKKNMNELAKILASKPQQTVNQAT